MKAELRREKPLPESEVVQDVWAARLEKQIFG